MSNTHGFSIVAEAGRPFLQEVLRGSWTTGGWKPGDTPVENNIPQFIELKQGTKLGDFVLQDGYVRIDRDLLFLDMAPPDGVWIRAGIHGSGHLQNPQVEEFSLIELDADLNVRVPVGTIPGKEPDIGILLSSIKRQDVFVALKGGRALIHAHLADVIAGLVKGLVQGKTVPSQKRTIQLRGINAYFANEQLDIITGDDTRQLHVNVTSDASGDRASITIPVQWTFYVEEKLDDLAPNLEPMMANADFVFSAPVVESPPGSGNYTVVLNDPSASNSAVNIQPPPGGAATMYNKNQATLGADFLPLVAAELDAWTALVMTILPSVALPTPGQVESAIGDFLADTIGQLGAIDFWPPRAELAGLRLEIKDATPRSLDTSLAIAINSGPGADITALRGFVGSRSIAVAISPDGLQQMLDDAKHEWLGPTFGEPGVDGDINSGGHEYKVHSLAFTLEEGAVHASGALTIVNAILGSIDVDADFSVDIGFEWDVSAEPHRLKVLTSNASIDTHSNVIGWIVQAFLWLLGHSAFNAIFLMFGVDLARETAQSIGARFLNDPQLAGVAAWPGGLPDIGKVHAEFVNPIDISPDGITFWAE